MNAQLRSLIVIAGCVAAAASQASDVTYEVQGTFNDGGSFAGSFEYDPNANAYVDSSNPFGQYGITTTGGTEIGAGGYSPVDVTNFESSDSKSTPTELVITAGGRAIAETLVLAWNNALNGPDGGTQQSITDGYEIYQLNLPPGLPPDERQVVSGFVEPVPLPASVWLILSGLGGLGTSARCRRRPGRDD